MKVEYQIAAQPALPEQLKLEALFHVTADHSYHVSHPPHGQGRFAVVYTMAGQGTLCVRGKAFSLLPDTAVLVSPQEPYEYSCPGARWDFWWADCTGATANLPFNTLIPVGGESLLAVQFALMLRYLRRGQNRAASGMMCALCALLEDRVGAISVPEQTALLYQQADSYLRSHLAEATVAGLCRHLQMSEKQLRRLFWQHTSCPPAVYLTRVRMENAAYLLRFTTKPVEEISRELGFCNQFYFSKAFKKAFGLPPLRYRQGGNAPF